MRRPVLALLVAGAVAAGAVGASASSAPAPVVPDPLAYGFQGEGGLLAGDADRRAGRVLPTALQQRMVADLGARVEWGPLGSPHVLTKDLGYLSGPAKGKAVDVARAWVRANAALFGLSVEQTAPERLAVLHDVPLLESPDLRLKMQTGRYPDRKAPHVVAFQQVYGDAPAAHDGLLTLGLDADNRVTFVSSTVSGATDVTNVQRVSPLQALLNAAKDAKVELDADDLTQLDGLLPSKRIGFRRAGVAEAQLVRLTTVPTPQDGVRLVWEAIVLQGSPGGIDEHGHQAHPHAYRSLVDAETGEVLARFNALQHSDDRAGAPGAASVPYFRVFPNAPKFPRKGVKTPDDRVFFCFRAGPECARVLGGKASPYAYDETLTDTGQRGSTFSTSGNNARTAPSRVSFLTPDVAVPATSPTRTYDFPFTDAWHTSGCNPAVFANPVAGFNDIDAATTNLFVMHNRMHDWSYYLGFTPETYNAQVENVGSERDTEAAENDPEVGNSQSGSIGGGPTFLGRDNANQITLNDGVAPVTNQYLWEPLQGGFYAACTDGAYDMGIVGHEYGHMISNRMTAGPDSGLSGHQAGAMGEAWSDLMGVEFLNGNGLAPYDGENRFSLAPYVTADKKAGIRNYGMNASPLNYSNLEYDGNGATSPHADGEIWGATQYDVRTALVKKYSSRFKESDKKLQIACADGTKPSTACPGNRRWIQLLFDGFLLQPSATTMLNSRDAILAADKMRYRGANQKELWAAFAKRGMGIDASSKPFRPSAVPAALDGTSDLDPTPGWRNPVGPNGTVTFRVAGAAPESTRVFVGDYEARSVPAVELEGAKAAKRVLAAGKYRLLVTAPGHGHKRMTVTVKPGAQTVTLTLRKNLASTAAGATVSGDGGNLGRIADDSEGTNWGSVEGMPRNPGEAATVRGKQVTVDLAGGAQTVREVQVSAANRPTNSSDPYDKGSQNRFAALYSFEILTCDATRGSDCKDDADFTSRLVKRGAFPAGTPRPTAPDLNIRSFAITPVKATHVRIKVLDNQCTGNPAFKGGTVNYGNPSNNPDCENGFTTAAASGAANGSIISLSQKKNVRIAELQVFSTR